jgi:inosine/xanthosine triphosphate pyrophosphatase family protein
MARATFITSNRSKARDVARLLAGVDVKVTRVPLSSVRSQDLALVARTRVLEAHAKLNEPCFLESAALSVGAGAPRFPPRSFKREMRALGEAGFAAKYAGEPAIARVVVAHTDDGREASLFEGELEGRIADAARGDGGYGWDRVFAIDASGRTMAEVAEHHHLFGMRRLPYLELADLLRGARFGGVFEAHVTVRLDGALALSAFRAACAELGVKCIEIELPEGETRSQPMTASYHRGELPEVQREVLDLSRALMERGFDVSRSKIEALGRNRDIPADDAEAARHPANYFEYHVKVLLPAAAHDAAPAPLAALVRAHDAHLSRSARPRPDGAGSSRFVTLRVHARGRTHADERWESLLGVLRAAGHPLGAQLREYTVYDTDPHVDRGWL